MVVAMLPWFVFLSCIRITVDGRTPLCPIMAMKAGGFGKGRVSLDPLAADGCRCSGRSVRDLFRVMRALFLSTFGAIMEHGVWDRVDYVCL